MILSLGRFALVIIFKKHHEVAVLEDLQQIPLFALRLGEDFLHPHNKVYSDHMRFSLLIEISLDPKYPQEKIEQTLAQNDSTNDNTNDNIQCWGYHHFSLLGPSLVLPMP